MKVQVHPTIIGSGLGLLFAILCFWLMAITASCGGNGGSATVETPLPQGCVEVGSVANSGSGSITIVANCTTGNGNSSTACFESVGAGDQPVSVPCTASATAAVGVTQ